MESVDYTNIVEVLAFLAAPTSAMAWAIAVSDWYRNQAWMDDVLPAWRQIIVLATQVVPPVAAHVILQVVPQEAIEAAAPHFALAAAVAMAVMVSRGLFELTQNRTGGVG